jgi:hypothetical protein
MNKDNVNSSYKGKTKTDQENVYLSVFSHGFALIFQGLLPGHQVPISGAAS